MNKVRNIEDFSADILNEDFIRIFQPIFIMLRILGFLRVNIKYKYPSAPSIWYLLYSNIFWILNTVCIAYVFLRCESGYGSPYADSAFKLGVLMNGINGVLIVFRNTIHRGNKIGQMYVKLQRIERLLNMKNSKSLNKELEKQSTFTIMSGSFFTILWIVLCKTLIMKNMCIPLIIITITGVGLHFEMVESYFIIQLIITRVNYINDILRQETTCNNKPMKKPINSGNLFLLMKLFDHPVKEIPAQLVSAVHCIFEALADFTELHQLSVSI